MTQGSYRFASKGQFSGHETFPLRLLWLKKAYDAASEDAPSAIFQDRDAIARFGVGRNMAVSMRFWALASGFFEEENRIIRPTRLGKLILADDGLDPYLEQAATVWLVHWHVASTPLKATTPFYVFNILNTLEFDAALLLEELTNLVAAQDWRATKGTLKRDVEVFLRSYVRRTDSYNEDTAEPLLAELGLIRESRLGGWHEFVRGPKPTLPDSVFAYAFHAFWEQCGGPTTLTAEQICYAPGSPGRVFKLDEDSVVTRLMQIDGTTDMAWKWVDTAGLRQIQRKADFDPIALVSAGYVANASRKTAA